MDTIKSSASAPRSRPAKPKTAPCDGCGKRLPLRDLLEVHDWHESLTFFEGDLICEECAGAHGVL
jgi:hypothetical protein